MSHIRIAAAALLAATLAACSDTPSAPDAAPVPEPISTRQSVEEVVPGEILIKMKDGISLDVLTGGSTGLRLERHLAASSRASVLRVEPGRERAEAARLAADPRVEYAEPNYIRRVQGWEHTNPGGLTAYFYPLSSPPTPLPAGYASLADADIDAVGGIGGGGSQVIIGSLDTGVDVGHPELAGKLILGWDWVNSDASPADDNGHGTHTIGSMVGTNVGVAGVTGAGTNVQVHVQKVCNASGSCPTSAIVNAIRAGAAVPGMVALNLSLSGPSISAAEVAAINFAVDTMGVLVIAAAGNNGTATVGNPAAYVKSISVAATNWRDAKAYYSQYGAGLDICAPGGELYSNTKNPMGIVSSYPTSAYAYLQGTSMAAPQVTGAAGVVASVTGLRGAALRTRLEGTVDDKGALGYDTVCGWGRLNVYRALTLATLPYPL
jgi:subtilisin family serine protease